MNSVTVIFSPYHVGVHGDEVGAGPDRFKNNGLLSAVRALGIQVVDVEVKPSFEAQGDIGRSFELYRQTSKLVTAARNASSFPIVISGNCSASVGVHAGLSGSEALKGVEVGCIWFDAHDDFNIPDTVLSGYFDSMPIATMAGQCWKALVQTIPGYRPLQLDRFVHCGLRDLNEMERARVVEAGYPVVWGSANRKVDFAAELGDILQGKEQDDFIVHVDLDCLDSTVGQVNRFEPAPGGLVERDFLDSLEMLPARVRPASLTVASYDPAYDTDGVISRVAIKGVSVFVESLLRNKHLVRSH